jgi:hypothetical protein
MIREPAVRALAGAFGVHLRDHYRAAGAAAGPLDRDRVLEALNALAISTAVVLAGTGGDHQALAFFLDTVEQQLAAHLAELAAEQGEPAPH